MKSILLAIAAALTLAACATPTTSTGANQGITQQTPAQIAAQICTPLEIALTDLQADVGLPAGALRDIALAAPQVKNLCSAAQITNTNDVQALENLAFNVVLPIAEQTNPKLAAELVAVQIVLGVVNAAQAGAVPPAISPAPGPAPAETTVPVAPTVSAPKAP